MTVKSNCPLKRDINNDISFYLYMTRTYVIMSIEVLFMDFDKIFEMYTKEAFRLETLTVYDVSEEEDAILEFKETGKVVNNIDNEWVSLLKIGKPVKRLRLLSNPLSDYEIFELEVYKTNLKYGEDIRIANRDDFKWF